jgi:uncharacterized protein DUF397
VAHENRERVRPTRHLSWRKSSYSATSSGNCVEVAFGGIVAVRDSKNPAGPILTVSPTAWRAFLSAPDSAPTA